MNIKHIINNDLNLLPVLYALLEEKNVSKAARVLGMTQPAVSHALARLRTALGDDLLVRASKGMAPTPMARELKSRIMPLISSLDSFYQPGESFDPKTAQVRITIGCADYIECVLLPKILARLRVQAPGVTVLTRSVSSLPKAELENGDFDLAIAGFFGELPEGYYQQKLYSDDFVSGVRADHPGFRGAKISLSEFASYDHLLISPQGDMKSGVDEAMRKAGATRRVVVGTNSFLSPLWVIAESDLVITCIGRLMESYTKLLPMRLFPCPVRVSPIHLKQVWHERTHRSPMHRWLRELIQDIAV